MSPRLFDATLRRFLQRRPFRPFTVELVSGDRIEVDHPEAMIVRAGAAAYLSPKGLPSIFDCEGVLQVIGAKASQQ
jgi:hypothetical protein